MLTQQYAQHDWSPTLAALVFLTIAILLVVGMGLSLLLGATREQRGTTARHAGHGPVAH
ncbi:MAG TPA: hypothetical protein VEW73_03965 [Nocardioides sp.]|nr:hypothetical protein [Nocardioides sp.]